MFVTNWRHTHALQLTMSFRLCRFDTCRVCRVTLPACRLLELSIETCFRLSVDSNSTVMTNNNWNLTRIITRRVCYCA